MLSRSLDGMGAELLTGRAGHDKLHKLQGKSLADLPLGRPSARHTMLKSIKPGPRLLHLALMGCSPLFFIYEMLSSVLPYNPL